MIKEERIIIREDKENYKIQHIRIKKNFGRQKVKILNEINLRKDWVQFNWDKIPLEEILV